MTTPTALDVSRRTAWRALAIALESAGLPLGVCIQPNRDDTGVAEQLPDGLCRLYAGHRGRQPDAWVRFLPGDVAHVRVEDVRRWIRPASRRDVDLEALGIRYQPGEPDIQVQLDLTEMLVQERELLATAPVRPPPPRSPPRRPVESIRAFGHRRDE